MDRKKFITKGLYGLGTIVALPALASSCSERNNVLDSSNDGCELIPRETAGPFPNKTPAELARENIISDRTGVPLLITLTIQDQSADCAPLADVFVDLWHCDAEGNYSQYGGLTDKNFLRGRQTTDANGQVSFISIFPGWYPGRAPHIHLEVLDASEKSIRVSQIAFPKDICDTVYASNGYKGTADTQNNQDGIFVDSLSGNMVDELNGNPTDGYTLLKTVVV
jgi:protocatechuate 3,4-dioxygenase beta subunit